jgi:hypothetical protein
MFAGDTYIYRSILTNDWQSTEKEVIEFIIKEAVARSFLT